MVLLPKTYPAWRYLAGAAPGMEETCSNDGGRTEEHVEARLMKVLINCMNSASWLAGSDWGGERHVTLRSEYLKLRHVRGLHL